MRRSTGESTGWHSVHTPAPDTGPTVLLEGPLAAPVEVWSLLREELRPHVGVVAYERAGVARSARRGTARTVATLADECVMVLDLHGLDRVVVVAEGFGGLIAHQVALRHPDRVDALVLIDCPHPAALTRSARQRQGAARLELELLRARWRASIRRPAARDAFAGLPDSEADAARTTLRRSPGTWGTALAELRCWKSSTGSEPRIRLPRDLPVALVTSADLVAADPSHAVLQADLLGMSAGASAHVLAGASASPATSPHAARAVRDLVLSSITREDAA